MSEPPPMRVDHVGIAVESIAEAEPVLFALGCERVRAEENAYGEFTWATYALGDASRIELIAPHDGSESFLTVYLDDHGPGLHHVTIEVADLDEATAALESAGVRVVDRTDLDDYSEAFLSPRNPTGALFQLMEYHEKYAATRESTAGLFVGNEPLGT